jgi:hypothetical protein
MSFKPSGLAAIQRKNIVPSADRANGQRGPGWAWEGWVAGHSGESPLRRPSLREAQRSVRVDPRWSAPYYWAGFVIQGEWR